ncbi:MAG TPA: hypothetical protein VEB41_11735, partial [Burkholderiales bacterium]|nr:hypothetical protein [Burkholderiales bacterium]
HAQRYVEATIARFELSPSARIVELARRWGDSARWQKDGTEHPHEAAALKLDSSKAERDLGWRPVLRLEHGLDWVAEWYQAAQRGGSAKALTLQQVERYRALCAA